MHYKCSECGQYHEDWPALAFSTPDHYEQLSEKEKSTITEINSDFCIISHDTQTDRFIRAVLFQKVNGSCEPLHYGVWVSLSEKNFNEYREHFENNKVATYFGYLCNNIFGYENTLGLKANIYVREGNQRPEVIPHECDHPFVQDYINGITVEEALRRINEMIDITERITPPNNVEVPTGFFRNVWKRIIGRN